MARYKIKYKGLSDVRSISVEDAKKHGVELSADLVWDRYGSVSDGPIPGINRPKYPVDTIVVEGLSDDLLKVLRAEETFTVTEVKDDSTDGQDIITGKPVDDTGSVVRDSTTGQQTVRGESNPDADPVPSGTESGGTDAGAGTAGDTGAGSSTDSTTTTGKGAAKKAASSTS